jgi:hypothetical protein
MPGKDEIKVTGLREIERALKELGVQTANSVQGSVRCSLLLLLPQLLVLQLET